MRDNISGVVTPKQTVTGQLSMADHVGGTRNYNDLENKPSIEGVELVGDKTLEELNINSYLSNYPSESRVIQIVNTAIGQIAIPVNTSDLVNDSDFQTGDDVIDAIAGAISGLDIPTRTSDLINDSNYQTSDDVDGAIDKALEDLSIPTKTSDLTNDSGFQTASDVDSAIDSALEDLSIPTKTSDLTNDSGFQTSSDVDTAIDTALEDIDIPTKVSDLTNDSGFQTASDVQSAIAAADIPTKLSDLTNDMTFQTLTEITNLINDAIGSAVGLNFEVVQTLPATGQGGTIYLVPNGGSAVVKNVYDEYVWYNGQWEKIGSTEIDLSQYLQRGTIIQGDKALITDSNGKAITGDTTATELGYVHGVTSAIQTQINGKVDKHQTDGVDDRLMTAAEGTKLGGIASGAEENVIVGVQKNGVDLTIDANRKVNVTVPTATSDLTNDSDFVSDANYVHTDNNYDATAKGIVDGVTTALADKVDKVNGKGLSTEDYTTAEKTKLATLQNYDDTALSGRVTAIEGVIPSGATSSNKLATASDVSGKQDTITGAATTIIDTDLTASKALVSDANGKVAVSDTTATELSYVHGVTSDIQTQLNSKASTSDLSDKQDTMQFSTMPTASADNVGDIVQFTGTTTASYTTGYFYQCQESSGTYSWVQTDVQPSGGGSGDVSQSEIAPVESTSTASKAYAVGDLFIYDGKLYRVTTAIASGGTITPGTNCTETSVSEVFVRKTGDEMSGMLTTPKLTVGNRASGYGSGRYSIVAGTNTVASSDYSYGFGNKAKATSTYSFATGDTTTASGSASFATGSGTTASGNYSHAEGNHTEASDQSAHAEGNYSTASGFISHAEGQHVTASGYYSHAEGYYTIAGYEAQHAQGKYNDNKSTSAFEIGNGTSNARSNALEVTWDGDVIASGDITDGQGNSLKGTNSNLAPIEATTTASQAYAVGDYFVYSGQLYKVTTAIASGGTIVPTGSGANVVATTVIMAINDMVGLALTASY